MIFSKMKFGFVFIIQNLLGSALDMN